MRRRVLVKLVAMPPADPEEESEDPRARRPRALDVLTNRSHDAILISARRGDGKTTFLIDLLKRLESGEYKKEVADRVSEKDIANLYSLGIVDPTLIESKHNIVVIVLDKIAHAAERAYRFGGDKKKKEYERFKEELSNLAAGIGLIDGIGDHAPLKDWGDPRYVLDKGLERAREGGGFERAFRAYVHAATKVVGADAFVLAVDDVDTSFERGWPVLEALRKYFATPRLKIIMAGDLKLYNLLVRQQQWLQIRKDNFDIERSVEPQDSYKDQIARMVGVLQDQYLVKIVKPDNRFELRSLLSVAEGSDNKIILKSSRNGTGRFEENIVTARLAEQLLALQPSPDVALIRAALLRLPLRSSLQVLSAAWALVDPTALPPDDLDPRRVALDALSSISGTALMSLDLDSVELDDPEPARVLGALVKWLTAKGGWAGRSRFHPEGVDETEDLARIRIAGRLVELFRYRPAAMFDYWLRLCTIRESIDRGDVSLSNLSGFIEHINVATSEASIHVVSRLASWNQETGRQLSRRIYVSGAAIPAGSRLRRPDSVVNELYGIPGDQFDREIFRNKNIVTRNIRDNLIRSFPAPLSHFHRKLMLSGWDYTSRRGSEAGFIGTFANSIDSLANRLIGIGSTVVMIPSLQIISGQGSENGVYSILRLIAFVGEIISHSSITDSDARRSAVSASVSALAIMRSYPTPSGKSVYPGAEERDVDDDVDTASEDGEPAPHADSQETLVELLLNWLDAFSGEVALAPLSPVTLARIWTRFVYAFDSIVEELRPAETRYLGVLMHRAVTAFLHSVGVEALRSCGVQVSKRLGGSPITSSVIFADLLARIDGLPADIRKAPALRYFEAIFSCPIWGYFLARSDRYVDGEADRDSAANPRRRTLSDHSRTVFKSYYKRARIHAHRNRISFRIVYQQQVTRTSVTFYGLFHVLNTVQIQRPGGQAKVFGRGKILLSAIKQARDAAERPPPIPGPRRAPLRPPD